MEILIPVLLALVAIFGPWILIGILFSRVAGLQSEVQGLQTHVRRNLPPADQPDSRPEPVPVPPEPSPEGPEPETPEEPNEPVFTPAEATPPPSPPAVSYVPPWEPDRLGGAVAANATAKIARAREGFEKELTSRWLVWLGGIAISLAGIFLTAYAIEQGYLGPVTRITLGFLFGLTLLVGGEWLRRRPFQQAIASIRPDYIPQALSAAGVFTMYASIYVGNTLYDLYPQFFTFLVLAAISLGAIILALLQGWFVALLGLVGSFTSPALVPSPDPSTLNLFTYLAVVLAASMAVVRYRSWWKLGYAALIFAGLWCLFWLADQYRPADVLIVGLYVLAIPVIFRLAGEGHEQSNQPLKRLNEIALLPPATLIGWAGFTVGAVLMFALVRTDGYTAPALVFLSAHALGTLWLAWREDRYDLTFVQAGVLVTLLFAAWHIRRIIPVEPLLTSEVTGAFPREFLTYEVSAAIFGLLLGAGGFAVLWGKGRAAIFAGVSAGVPVALFAIAYWRIVGFGIDLRWALAATLFAAITFAAATAVEKYRDHETHRTALGLYAAATVAFISLGLAMTLEQAWLTVALSLQLPALAWIHDRLKVKLLQVIALLITMVILSRLVLNPHIFDYAVQPGGLFNWILYGYGIPCAAFFWSARIFGKSARDYLVGLLEVGALTFAVLLVSFEIRFLVTGSLDASYDSLLEQSLQSIAWLTTGYGLLIRGEQLGIGRVRIKGTPILKICTYGLLILAALQVLLVQVFINGPLQYGADSIGRLPLFNLLLLAYLIPAAFALAVVPVFLKDDFRRRANFAGISGLFLLFVYVTLEIKHWFQSEYLKWPFVSDAENYAISTGWLVFALALLGAGILLNKAALRYGSLAVLLITVLKVFLFDLAGITGLFRVASFLGLGLTLVGIGYIYQRFVFNDTADTTPDPPEEETAGT